MKKVLLCAAFSALMMAASGAAFAEEVPVGSDSTESMSTTEDTTGAIEEKCKNEYPDGGEGYTKCIEENSMDENADTGGEEEPAPEEGEGE